MIFTTYLSVSLQNTLYVQHEYQVLSWILYCFSNTETMSPNVTEIATWFSHTTKLLHGFSRHPKVQSKSFIYTVELGHTALYGFAGGGFHASIFGRVVV